MDLIIVESPTKVKTITTYLKKTKVLATMGHIKDLPKSRMGIDINDGFRPEYKIIKGKKKIIKEIVEESKKSDRVFIATDPDREGEAIAYHIAEELPVKPKRVLFYEMTKSGIEKGMSEPIDIDMNKVFSQRTRRILDRLVGYEISPLLWKLIKKGLSAGRVQSVVLRLICEREEEIEKFVPKDYWVLRGRFIHPEGEFEAILQKINGKKVEILSIEEAEKLKEKIEKTKFFVKKFIREDVEQFPLPPLITSTLQRSASTSFGFSISKTMLIAQRLYEGVDLPEGTTGLITYMRTDSYRISKEAEESIREFIKNEYGEEYLPLKPNVFKSKETAQEAHEAIRPTDIRRTPEAVKAFLTPDEYKIYKLIWERALASQFKPAIFDSKVVIVEGSSFEFKGSSKNLKFEGFYKILTPPKEEEEIPLMKEGDSVELKTLITDKKTTEPPPRYSEASMVREMEKRGIGRPSTYSPIISTLFKRNYIKKVKGFLVPQEIGRIVNKILVKHFGDTIINCEFTSEMEKTLDEIEDGEKDWRGSIEEFYSSFRNYLDAIEMKISEIRDSITEEVDKKCPKCGKNLIVRWGKFGKFLACPGYPGDCEGYREPISEEVLNEKCPKCGGEVILKEGKFGRFKACKNYPDCDWTASISTGVRCPQCENGEFLEKRSKKGRIYYPCSNENCNNILWNKPILRECSNCGAPFMVEKIKRKENYFYCIKCKNEEKSS
ncbi:MAG: type I DNA topoisomerase [candidate division WOR-3 bacterium]